MKYISTRGTAPEMNFEEVLLTGLAADGGLYVPKTLPQFSKDEIASWAGLTYDELAFKIIQPFVADSIPGDDLAAILAETYTVFDHSAVAPLTQLNHNEWLLELYHGPTLAFKDFALQLLGRLLDYLLQRQDKRVAILGATSGDTGSAAIDGCKRCNNVDIYILHPHERVSEVQRRQMTTVVGDNIHNLAIKGSFDDCQRIVKACFNDQAFLGGERSLVAVNSINWARIMAQIVYYFYASLALGGPHREISFSVPTGNFGDIFAGYLAKKMGLPVKQLIVATNRNDILHRCISDNDYSQHQVEQTLTPSMDIMISSNFERVLFDFYQRDGAAIADLYKRSESQEVKLAEPVWQQLQSEFDSFAVDDAQTCETISRVYKETQRLVDPHTAVGITAARERNLSKQTPIVTLATAHAVKFPEAILKAGCENPGLPVHMEDLFEREERFDVLDNSAEAVQSYVSRG